jgi:1-acyl-sn-glycerol-3-phosphate acyltransferase
MEAGEIVLMMRRFDLFIYWLSKQVMWRYLASRLTIHVQGLERIPPHGAAIVIANHPCAIDGWLLICLIRRKLSFFIRAEHLAHPLANWYVRTMGGLPVRRGADNKASLAVAEIALREKHLFAIFPEGNVTPGRTLLPFQNSFLLLAVKLDVPVIPIVIVGTHKALRDPIRPRTLDAFKLQPTEVRMVVLEPMRFRNPALDPELFAQHREQVRQIIADKIGELASPEFG